MSGKFLVATPAEMRRRGWDRVDVVLVTGDAYVDHPAFGAAVIGRVLEAAGWRVAVLARPAWDEPGAFAAFGPPRLFFGVSGGNVDSTLARYTAFRRVRNDDPYAPGGEAGGRPERAVLTYAARLKAAFPRVPLVLGGIEASMRRFAHYDFWSGKVRRSLLAESGAAILVHGMGEAAAAEIARRLAAGEGLDGVPGTVIRRREAPPGAVLLPGEEEVRRSPAAYAAFFKDFYRQQRRVLAQPAGAGFLVQYPARGQTTAELDAIHALPFARAVHPRAGRAVPAFAMIRHSVTAHRGCLSGCAFCSLAMHQGRRIVSRSPESVLAEVALIAGQKDFRGRISDIGGPSANMYGAACRANWNCRRDSCLFPDFCERLRLDQAGWLDLLDAAAGLPGIEQVTVGSGLRFDLLGRAGPEAIGRLARRHVAGQLKIAPEHTEAAVLELMRKAPVHPLAEFAAAFRAAAGGKRFLLPYLMSGHPGCRLDDMRAARRKVKEIFGFIPEQSQAFIPLPLTLSGAMYHAGVDPLTGEKVFAERDAAGRRRQHQVIRPGAPGGSGPRSPRG